MQALLFTQLDGQQHASTRTLHADQRLSLRCTAPCPLLPVRTRHALHRVADAFPRSCANVASANWHRVFASITGVRCLVHRAHTHFLWPPCSRAFSQRQRGMCSCGCVVAEVSLPPAASRCVVRQSGTGMHGSHGLMFSMKLSLRRPPYCLPPSRMHRKSCLPECTKSQGATFALHVRCGESDLLRSVVRQHSDRFLCVFHACSVTTCQAGRPPLMPRSCCFDRPRRSWVSRSLVFVQRSYSFARHLVKRIEKLLEQAPQRIMSDYLFSSGKRAKFKCSRCNSKANVCNQRMADDTHKRTFHLSFCICRIILYAVVGDSEQLPRSGTSHSIGKIRPAYSASGNVLSYLREYSQLEAHVLLDFSDWIYCGIMRSFHLDWRYCKWILEHEEFGLFLRKRVLQLVSGMWRTLDACFEVGCKLEIAARGARHESLTVMRRRITFSEKKRCAEPKMPPVSTEMPIQL
eukprot:IDg22091t1